MLGLSSPEGQPSPSHPGSFPGQSALSQGRLWILKLHACGSPSSSPICNNPQHARLNWLPAEGTRVFKPHENRPSRVETLGQAVFCVQQASWDGYPTAFEGTNPG